MKIAIRSLIGNKLYSLINVFGLALGLFCVILIGLYVEDELGFDRQFAGVDRLYRISRDFLPVDNAQESRMAGNAEPVAGLLKSDFPQIGETARLVPMRSLLAHEDIAYFESGLRFADPSLFRLFGFEWLQGTPETAFEQTRSIVLTDSSARRYFGDTNPVGRQLLLENETPLVVTGVIADLPPDSHLSGTAFVPVEVLLLALGEEVRGAWTRNIFHTYFSLKPGSDIREIRERIPAFLSRHIGEDANRWTGMGIMKVTDIHLHSRRQGELKPPGNMDTVLTLISVAAGILLIACCNFMNLGTARSSLRGKEVGVRKTIGSRRGELMLQFLAESVSLTLLAMLLALGMVELALPGFNAFTGKQVVLDLMDDIRLQLMLAGLVLTVGCLAGAYPAFYLSAFNPVQVLGGRSGVRLGDVLLRNLLVVLQFSLSIVLIVSTVVVLLQTRYARNFDPGFEREKVLVLDGSPSQGLTAEWEALKQELLRYPGIESVSAAAVSPGMEILDSVGVRPQGSLDGRTLIPMWVDYDFFSLFDIELLAGRVFSRDYPNDAIYLRGEAGSENDMSRENRFVLNESAAREFGWSPEEAVGQRVEVVYIGDWARQGRVAGVVADSNFESLRFDIKPLVFMLAVNGIGESMPTALNKGFVRISAQDNEEALAYLDRSWNTLIPGFPLSRSFLDNNFDALYRSDERLGQLFSQFSLLAILIACLGLYGLATFSTQRRIKEIGIRKVMGGTVWNIVLLLTNDFSKLVLMANVVAWPVAYVVMQRWLDGFAYRIDLTPLIFIGSGLIALCVAWVTVGSTAAQAASRKPVLALRYE